MLVLSRKKDESIRIGSDILITVVRIERGKVRLGITCPRDINVARTEVDTGDPASTPTDAPRASPSP